MKKTGGGLGEHAITEVGTEAVGLSADTFAFVYGEYSQYVSAKSLEEALDKFGPSMAKITELVQSRIADARRLFSQQIEAQVRELEAQAQTFYLGFKFPAKTIVSINQIT